MRRRDLIANGSVALAGILLAGCSGELGDAAPFAPSPPLPGFPGVTFDPGRTVFMFFDGASSVSERLQFVDAMRRQFGLEPELGSGRWGVEIVGLNGYRPRSQNPEYGFIFSLRGIHFDINAYDPRLIVAPGDRVTVYVAR